MYQILIVDNDPVSAGALCQLLTVRGFHTGIVANADQAQDMVTKQVYDLVIIDADLAPARPGTPNNSTCDGYELHQRLAILQPALPVLLITGRPDTAKAISAIKLGAIDYLARPVDETALLRCINTLATRTEPENVLIAVSPSSQHTVQLARKVAVSPATVLITGESGTGKEVLSRFIHDHSQRASGPFVAVNCAAIPESMLESILFGHEKGAFTGATSRREGKFEQANGGTLFLDEVAEMPLAQQAKLLRVLQEREVDRLGGSAPIKLDVRVLAATNRDLHQQVVNGTFREDLYYRLNVFPIHWAPLRERREDIIPLTNALLKRMAQQGNMPVPALTAEAERQLLCHAWPGNVRELDNVLQRAVILSGNHSIGPGDLMLDSTSGQAEIHSAEISREIDQLPGAGRKKAELQHIIQCLCRHRGHRGKTAEALGISTRMLRYKLARLREMGIDTDNLTFDAPVSNTMSPYFFGSDNSNVIFA